MFMNIYIASCKKSVFYYSSHYLYFLRVYYFIANIMFLPPLPFLGKNKGLHGDVFENKRTNLEVNHCSGLKNFFMILNKLNSYYLCFKTFLWFCLWENFWNSKTKTKHYWQQKCIHSWNYVYCVTNMFCVFSFSFQQLFRLCSRPVPSIIQKRNFKL